MFFARKEASEPQVFHVNRAFFPNLTGRDKTSNAGRNNKKKATGSRGFMVKG